MSFVPPAELVVLETEYWIINQRVDCPIPGYLMLGAKDATVLELSDASAGALSELGHLQSWVTGILTDDFDAWKVYIGRFGHDAGHTVHFHLIPVYRWLLDRYHLNPAYHDREERPDGSDVMRFIWREYCESESFEPVPGPAMADALADIRRGLVEKASLRSDGR